MWRRHYEKNIRHYTCRCAPSGSCWAFLYAGDFLGKRPFKDLKTDLVESAAVYAALPDKTVVISKKEALMELADILNRITIYQQDDSASEYMGQFVRFTLTMKDGRTIEVGALR